MTQEQATSRQAIEDDQSSGEIQLGDLVGQIAQTVEDYVHESPHVALAAAGAVGFVLGGGLTPRRLFRLAFAAGGPLLSRQLTWDLVKKVTSAFEGGATSDEPFERKTGKRRSKRVRAEEG